MRSPVPYEEQIPVLKDKEIWVKSIFEFHGQEELFYFLHLCRENNIVVHFIHEERLVEPDVDFNAGDNLTLIFYSWLSTDPSMVHEYWDFKEHEKEILA